MRANAKKLLFNGIRWLYWTTRAYVEDPVLAKTMNDVFMEGQSSVSLHVQSPQRSRGREMS